MKIELKLCLNKDNEGDMEYANIIDMSFMSYNILKNTQSPDLLDITCESCDYGSEIIYSIGFNQDINIDDLKKLFSINDF